MKDPEAGAGYYPIKRKGQPRRLNPNWSAINWLSLNMARLVGLYEKYGHGDTLPDGRCEFIIERALGWHHAKRKGMYPRPVFQVFDLETSSSVKISYTDPCPACDDWSRTSRCSEHHDRDGVAGLAMGAGRRSLRSEERAVRAYEAGREDSAVLIADAIRNQLGLPPITDGRRLFPADIQEAERERQRHQEAIRNQLMSLGEFTITLEGTFDPALLEISGDIVQGAAQTVRIEAERNDGDA